MLRSVYKLLLAIIVLASCSESRTLQEAEALLETDPQKADSILTSMAIPKRAKDYALYAVLKTQADYKQYKPITSDSLILTATEYYGTRHRSKHAAMAWYSQGCVYNELKNDLAAIEAYIKAEDLFPDTINRYYALTEQRLGKSYLSKGMFDESYSSFNKCRIIAETIKDSALIANCDYHMALINLQNYHYDGLIDSFKKIAVNKNLSYFYRNESFLNLAKLYIYDIGLYDSANCYLDSFKIRTTASLGVVYNLKGEIYYKLGYLDSSYFYFQHSLDEDCDLYTQCSSSRRLSELSWLKGNNNDAFLFEKLYTQSLDSIRVLTNANDIAAISIAHKEEIETLKRKEYRSRVIIATIFIIFLLFSIFSIFYQSYSNQINRRYIQFCDRAWTKITSTLPLDASDDKYLSLCKTRYLNSPSHYLLLDKGEKTKLIREEKEAIKHDLSVAFSDLTLFMLNKYPTISKREIQICYLNYLMIDKPTICEIMDLSDDSFRKAKSRLKDKLGDSFNLYFA